MNYWQILASAREALAAGRLRRAEEEFLRSGTIRAAATRRVFFQETIPDGLQRAWRRLRQGSKPPADPTPDEAPAGRWQRATEAFLTAFRDQAEAILHEAERRLATGAGTLESAADPAATAALLADALSLSVGSELSPRQLPAAPLLLALFDLLPASGRLADHDLVARCEGLDGSVRLRLAERGAGGLVHLPLAERAVWAGTLLALLDREAVAWQPGTGAARRWLAANLADRYRDDAQEVLACLAAADEPEQPEANRRYSRLRRLEILAGCDRRRLAVPSYAEAHRLAAALLPDVDGEQQRRCQAAMDVIAHRRPPVQPSRGWISATVAPDGTVLAVYWWGDEPRDLATWRPADGPGALAEFLDAAPGRVLWAEEEVPEAVREAWPDQAFGRPLLPYLEALLEPSIPAEGWQPALGHRLALARSGAWRTGWRPDRGHPMLVPPGANGEFTPEQAAVQPALQAGLLWLAVLHRVASAAPALRAGIGELARRGDPWAAFLHAHAVLGAPDLAAVDAAFAPWTLPLLWTRPDPLGGGAVASPAVEARPDLGGQDVAVVVTGQPMAALLAWGQQERRWRLVLDRADRLVGLRPLVAIATEPVTLVPPGGEVHDLRAALALLDDLAREAHAAEGSDRLLALYHWIRLVETHNGDLLDIQMLRPRRPGACPLLERHAARVQALPRRRVGAGDGPGDDGGWQEQYTQRARRSGLLVGLVQDLPGQPAALDAGWGVYDGSDAAWVFLDAAAVHWRLDQQAGDQPTERHALLASRGRRHLSILGGRGVFAADLADWFDQALASYGRPYHADLGDSRPPPLVLAGAGPLPQAHLNPAAHPAAALIALGAMDEGACVRTPRDAASAALWREAAAGRFGAVAWRLVGDATPAGGANLVVVSWAALAATDRDGPVVPAAADPHQEWHEADQRRLARRGRERRSLALECAALLAEPVAAVTVLDGRWWRLVGVPEQAAAAQTQAPVRDLPDAAATGRGRDLLAAINGWLVQTGEVGAQLPGWPGPPLVIGSAPDDGAIAPPGVYHHREPAQAVWRDLAAGTLRRWEAGLAVGRVLLIGAAPPAGALALADACAGAGATRLVAAAGAAAEGYGTVVWARPQDLLAILQEGAPLPSFARALVHDLGAHLPPSPSALAGAPLLGWLLQGGIARVDLVGGPLPAPWADFLAARCGRPIAGDDPGGWAALRRGESPRHPRRCPQCADVGPGRLDGLVCAGCGYALAAAGPRPAAVDPAPEQVRLLLQQADLGRDRPLELWADAGMLDGVRAAAEAAGVPLATDDEPTAGAPCWQLPDGRRWAPRPLGGDTGVARGPAVLLKPPRDPALLVPWCGPESDGALHLSYDRFDLAAARHGAEAPATARLLALLRDPAWLESVGPESAAVAAGLGATVPLWRLAWLAGISPAAARRSLELLQWVRVLVGEEPPPRARERALAAQLLLQTSRRSMQQQLADLAARLVPTLPPLLAGGVAGAWQIAPAVTTSRGADLSDDASQAPALGALDSLLGLLAASPAPAPTQLIYQAPGGAWFSRRRLVGWLGDRHDLSTTLVRHLDAFAVHLGDLLAGVAGDASDQLVDVRAAPDLIGAHHLLLGQELGFWTRIGAATRHAVPWDDLQRLARSEVLADQHAGSRLLLDLARGQDDWRRRLDSTPAGGGVNLAVAAGAAPLRRRRPGDGSAAAPEAATVSAWLQGRPGRLVLAGPCGTGRVASAVEALAKDRGGAEAVCWAPDQATAVRLHLEWRRLEALRQPDIRVLEPGDPLPGPAVVPPGGRPVTIIAELQRFPREVAYHLQDRARDGHLLLLVDTAEVPAGVAWEDLFLTTPRRDEVRHLRVQRLQAGQLWRVTRPLLQAVPSEARSRRRQRGQVQARPAGSLDECAAAVATAAEAGKLGQLVHLVAPLAEDVQLLLRALSDRGWAAVRQPELQPLLLPGALEAVAALADAHAQRHGFWPQQASTAAAAASAPRRWLLTELVPDLSAADWSAWLRGLGNAVLDDAPAFWTLLRRSPWGPLLAGSTTSRRVLGTLLEGGGSPGDMLAPALWTAWQRTVATMLALGDAADDPPVACLAAAGEPVGPPVESLVYICFGPEPPAVHRRVLSRATDRLLVLYQEHSPLPDQRDG